MCALQMATWRPSSLTIHTKWLTLVIPQPPRTKLGGTQLQQPALQLAGHGVELGIAAVSQAEDAELQRCQGSAGQVPAKEEPPEGLQGVQLKVHEAKVL